jgi:hypothetical protein
MVFRLLEECLDRDLKVGVRESSRRDGVFRHHESVLEEKKRGVRRVLSTDFVHVWQSMDACGNIHFFTSLLPSSHPSLAPAFLLILVFDPRHVSIAMDEAQSFFHSPV